MNNKNTLNSHLFSLGASLFFVIFYNSRFFSEIFHLIDYHSIRGAVFLVNISALLWLLTYIFVSLLITCHFDKLIVSILFFIAAAVAYFMDTYGIVIHRMMIQNLMETDLSEVQGLLSPRLAIYLIALGLGPALLLYKIPIHYDNVVTEIWRKCKYAVLALIVCLMLVASMAMDYASFFRNHKNIRQMANPLNFVYAGISYIVSDKSTARVQPIENDAAINELGKKHSKPSLVILVVGETARADHFGINHYHRDTTPLIAQQHIINFPQVTSCGTETAISVPCMFSALGRNNYSDYQAKAQQGLLDVIQHSGIRVLWRDNNSSCKGTCDRVDYEDMRFLKVDLFCNSEECSDEILLHQLSDRITETGASQFIVLHQKGSHGPDYFNRHPRDWEFFTPECKTNQLQHCTQEEVINAYDNSIRYTDYFLNKTIEWLRTKSSDYNTGLVYLSDHGESLGENNVYLHGMPYSIAPRAQKHVPFFLWLSDDFTSNNNINIDCLKRTSTADYSHDNLFHTVLGLLNISTRVYREELDMIKPCRQLTPSNNYVSRNPPVEISQ